MNVRRFVFGDQKKKKRKIRHLWRKGTLRSCVGVKPSPKNPAMILRIRGRGTKNYTKYKTCCKRVGSIGQPKEEGRRIMPEGVKKERGT